MTENSSLFGGLDRFTEPLKQLASKLSDVVAASTNIDLARQNAAPIVITQTLKDKLVELQTGQVSALALDRDNDPEVVKFLQAVVGLEQTGVFNKELDRAVRKIQGSYYIDSVSGQVSATPSSQAAAFISDGVVRDSIRAFVQRALEDGRITQEQFASVSTPFDESTKNRWLFFAAPVASWLGNIPSEFLNTVDATGFAARRASFSGSLDGDIEARVDDILDYVNTGENWRRLGLKWPINDLGARRIQKALQVIASVESVQYGRVNYVADNPLSTAFGCYQFMEATEKLLRQHKVVTSQGFPSAKTKENRLEQDFAAIWLIGSEVKGRKVLGDIVEGRPAAAMYQLACEWAGLPYDRRNLSKYESRINHAGITFDQAVANMTVLGEGGYKIA